MFAGASAFDQPLSFDVSKVTNVSVYSLIDPNCANDRPYLTSTAFSPPCYQMNGMFFSASAFNQPLSFDTAKVTSVRLYSLSQTVERVLVSGQTAPTE